MDFLVDPLSRANDIRHQVTEAARLEVTICFLGTLLALPLAHQHVPCVLYCSHWGDERLLLDGRDWLVVGDFDKGFAHVADRAKALHLRFTEVLALCLFEALHNWHKVLFKYRLLQFEKLDWFQGLLVALQGFCLLIGIGCNFQVSC